MFRGFSQLFKKSGKDLRKRIYFTLLCLGIFCLGTRICIPGVDVIDNIYESLGVLQIFDLMSGGGLQTFSIFALGVSPYITASIITQLLQMDVVPYFKELKEQGYVGRQKINKINRYIAIILAFLQAYMLCILYLNNPGTIETIRFSVIMTAGTCFCLWMGDQITKNGIGNGSSMIIMAGIVQSMPAIFAKAFNGFIHGAYSMPIGITYFSIFVLIYILIIVGIIYMQLAERRIPIQYANRTTSAYGANQSYLPIKLNAANVIPVIFAQILLTIPSMIAAFTKNQNATDFISKYIQYNSPTGLIIYIILILFFSYFYTFMVLNPEDMSKNLNQRGGYIPGIRPGNDTAKYISKSVSRLTIVGGIGLAILAILPVLFQMIFRNNASLAAVSIGGTGLLIVVGVAIETYRQIESRLLSNSYKEKRKRLR